MHEFSIVQALLERVDAEARQREASTVLGVSVRIGELSGVEIELLESAFLIARDGGICSRASLSVTPVKARWSCPSCERTLAAGSVLSCPDCSMPARLVEGGEIVLERIEMEVPDV